MDLRDRTISPRQMAELHDFIVARKLAYQPFIFRDGLETGEGMRFVNGGAGGTICWKDADQRVRDILTTDPVAFRRENAILREIYDDFVEQIASTIDVPGTSFAEVGCNTGYFLYRLAQRGAGRCIGYDFTNNSRVFAWFNEILHTRCEFCFSEWDSFQHRLRYARLPKVDVTLSVAVTCHLADPIHHLTCLCERASKAVFFWCPVNSHDGLALTFGPPGKYPNALAWPLGFDNEVRISVPLLKLTIEQCGFDIVHEIQPPDGLPERWRNWHRSQRGFIALRTAWPETAYANGRVRRRLPGDAMLPGSFHRLLKIIGLKRKR